MLAEGHLVEEPVLAEEVAVIGGEDHDRVVGQPARLEGREHLADPLVDVRQARVVAVTRRAHVVLRDLDVAHREVVPEPSAVRVALRVRQARRGGQVDLVVRVQIPVSLPRDVRIVRMA